MVLEDGRIVREEATPTLLLSFARSRSSRRSVPGVRRDRRSGSWRRRIETLDLPDDPGGDAIELAWDGTERSVRIDGMPTLAGVPALERLAAARHPRMS